MSSTAAQQSSSSSLLTEEEKNELVELLISSARCGDAEDVHTILRETSTTSGKYFHEFSSSSSKTMNKHFVNSTDEHGRTALFFACANGHLDVVKILVNEFNADIEKTTKTDESTALHWACLNGHSEVVKLLLEKGGKNIAFKVNKNNRTPMDEAMHNDRQECVKVIMDLTDDGTEEVGDDIEEEGEEEEGEEEEGIGADDGAKDMEME
jgi:ankyrin repeat protein